MLRETDTLDVAQLNIKILEGPGHLPIHSQVKHAIMYAIGSGQLSSGMPIPSVRELAGHLGLATNTVARAYQELQDEGLLVTRAGRGTFVSELIEGDQPAVNGSATLERILKPALASAQAVGYTREEIRAAVDHLLGQDLARVGLVGLTEAVVERWTGILKREYADLDIDVVPLTLDELRRDVLGAVQRFKGIPYVFTLVTTYAEVRGLLQPYGKKVSALITELALTTHEELGTLPPNIPVGLVCLDLYENSMLGVISPYVSLDLVRRVSYEDGPALADLMQERDIILHTSAATAKVTALARPETRLVELQFLPNRACFDQIRHLLQQEYCR